MLIHLDNNAGFQYDVLTHYKNIGQQLRIGIIDADLLDGGTRHPNLALLKISGFCRDILGHDAVLVQNYDELGGKKAKWEDVRDNAPYDVLCISQVFKFTNHPSFIDDLKTNGYIYWGGTGFAEIGGPQLPYEVEHHMPYYNLYLDYIEHITNGDAKLKKKDWDDYLSYSIGFTTRGCIRHCAFCVNRESNGVKQHADVAEFYDPTRPRIYLWDDNILAAPPKVLNSVIDQLKATKKPFQFRQGMDIRLLDDKKSQMLCDSSYYGDFIFAFDHYRRDDANELRNVKQTIRGLQMWRKHNDKATKLYVIVGFDSIGVDDIVGTFWRIRTLMYFGCLPYIMRFENYVKSEYKDIYIQLARWCNQPNMFKKLSFREFCERNEFYYQSTPKPGKHCSCYRAMLNFEEKYPEVAEEYFDLKFDTERRSAFLGKEFKNLPIEFFDNPNLKINGGLEDE